MLSAHGARANWSAPASSPWLPKTAILRIQPLSVCQSARILTNSHSADHSRGLNLSLVKTCHAPAQYDISVIGVALRVAIPGERRPSGRLHLPASQCTRRGVKTTVQNGVAAAGHSTQKTMRRPCEVISNDQPSPESTVGSHRRGMDKTKRGVGGPRLRLDQLGSPASHNTLLCCRCSESGVISASGVKPNG